MYGTFLNSTLSIDIGGTHLIKTNQELLCSVEGTLLQKMFSGAHDIPVNEAGHVFLDRDGATFLSLINYLRNNRKDFPKFDSIEDENLFMSELEFWNFTKDLKEYKKQLGSKPRKTKTERKKSKSRSRSPSP